MLKVVKRASGAVFAGSAYPFPVMGQGPLIAVRTSNGSGWTGGAGHIHQATVRATKPPHGARIQRGL